MVVVGHRFFMFFVFFCFLCSCMLENHYKSYSPSCKGRVRVGAAARCSELWLKKKKTRKTHGFQMQHREFLDLHWKGLFFCIEKGLIIPRVLRDISKMV